MTNIDVSNAEITELIAKHPLPTTGGPPPIGCPPYRWISIWAWHDATRRLGEKAIKYDCEVTESEEKPPIAIVYKWVRVRYFYRDADLDDGVSYTEMAPRNAGSLTKLTFYTTPINEDNCPELETCPKWALYFRAYNRLLCDEQKEPSVLNVQTFEEALYEEKLVYQREMRGRLWRLFDELALCMEFQKGEYLLSAWNDNKEKTITETVRLANGHLDKIRIKNENKREAKRLKTTK